MADMDDIEVRIREKAHKLWEEAGRPEGRAAEHWEKARILVAIEDDHTSLKPIEQASSEPLEIQDNLGEAPGALTDQGDRMQVPSDDIATTRTRGRAPARKPAVHSAGASKPAQAGSPGGEKVAASKSRKPKG
jgi:Protein of unknown function (DUF2934)